MEEHVFDLLPGYALGSLDGDEILLVSKHLTICAACREELATYRAAVDQLALSAPLQTPSPDLKNKVLNRVSSRVKMEERPGFFDAFRQFINMPVGLALGALSLIVILVLGLSNLLLSQQVNALQARTSDSSMQIIRLKGTEASPEARGYLMTFANETYGTLVVEDAPPLDADHQYQLWLIRDGKRTSGGVFSVDQDGYGALQISAQLPLETYPSFGVTIEPAGGSPGPTGQKVMGGDQ